MKSKLIAAIALSLLLAGSATAVFGYWTAHGNGIAQATVAPNPSSVAANQSVAITGVDPGAAPQTLSGTFSNSGAVPSYVTSVTVSMSVQKAVGAPSGSCTLADYTLSNPVMQVGREIPVGISVGSWGGATIAFATNPTAYQDACKGAILTFTYTIS